MKKLMLLLLCGLMMAGSTAARTPEKHLQHLLHGVSHARLITLAAGSGTPGWSSRLIVYSPLGLAPVVQLGSWESIILVDGAARSIPTAELTFSGSVPAEKSVAILRAPDPGRLPLLQRPDSNARSLGHCPAGAVVAVLEYDCDFCRIHCDGGTGYVPTVCLRFCGDLPAPTGTGVLTMNGKATGRTKIPIHSDPAPESPEIAQWRTGTKALVFSHTGEWYEVEQAGMHGYVQQDYLTINE